MSTLVAQTLSNGTVSTSTANCIQGSAKAWVNFNGTTSPGTIRSQYNVSSVTKNGTGDYTINFTNALSDANYCVSGMQANLNDGIGPTIKSASPGGAPSNMTTTAVQIIFRYAGNDTYYDVNTATIIIHR